MTDLTQRQIDDVALMMGYAEGIDATDIVNVADGSVTSLVVDWGFVSHIESVPDPTRITVEGETITIPSDVAIHLKDGGTINVELLISGNATDGIPGLTNIVRVGHEPR